MLDANGQRIRIKVVGPPDAHVDLTGAHMVVAPFGSADDLQDGIADGQFPVVNDVPGRFDDGTEVLGGVGGEHGVLPISVVTGGDPFIDLNSPFGNLPHFSVGVKFDGIASNKVGDTWGVNIRDLQGGGTSGKRIEIAQLAYKTTSDATVVADVAPQIVALVGAMDTNSIQSINGADFLPSNDNLLYFVATVSVPRFNAIGANQTMPTESPVPFLFVFNTSSHTLGLAGEFQSDPTFGGDGDVAPAVTGFTFRNTDDAVVVFMNGKQVGINGADQAITTKAGIVTLTLADLTLRFRGGLDAILPVFLGTTNSMTTNLTEARALEVLPGDDGHVYMITGMMAMSILVRAQISNGVAENFGPLPNNQPQFTIPAGGRIIGQDINDITWNPVLHNVFLLTDSNPNNDTRKGLLLGADVTADELVIIDARSHFPNTGLYAITVSGGDASASVSMAVVPAPPTVDRPMQPLNGSTTIRKVNAFTGLIDGTTSAAGGVLIGVLTLDTIMTTMDEQQRIVTRIRKPNATSKTKNKFTYAGVFSIGDWGDLLIGGTVTGRVALNGSAGTFYAGTVWTGDGLGRTQGSDFSDVAGNFYVGGNLNNLVTLDTLGSDGETRPGRIDLPIYLTGFDMNIRGHLGMVKTLESFFGRATVVNNVPGDGAAQKEVESRQPAVSGSASYFEGVGLLPPSLGDLPLAGQNGFNNDTFDTAQYLGTALAPGLGGQAISLVGELNNVPPVNDGVDYYGVSLLAGQKMTVQLVENGLAHVGVFDPDGRLIATDYNRVEVDFNAGKPFQVTADRPGVYRIAIASEGDVNFNGNLDPGEAISTADTNYNLLVSTVADIALGGIVANTNIFTHDPFTGGFEVDNGDLGALHANDTILSLSLPYDVLHGNLRSIDATTVGFIRSGAAILGPDLLAEGSVGMVRATGTIGGNACLDINSGLALGITDPITGQLISLVNASTGDPDPAAAVGLDYQLLDAPLTVITGSASADRSIGIIRGMQITDGTTNPAPIYIANADHLGDDGTIDLIDTTANCGDAGAGGPSLFTGPNGNVRFMRVGGALFASAKFGRLQRQATPLQPGEEFKFTDDSGTPGVITPGRLVPNPNFDGVTDTNKFLAPGFLTVRTFAVDDNEKAGVVLVDVLVGDPNLIPVANHGIDVKSSGIGTQGSIEIGKLTFLDSGLLRTGIDPDTGTPRPAPFDTPDPLTGAFRGIVFPSNRDNEGEITPDLQSPIDATFHGNSRIDVFDIVGAHIDNINDETDGEIRNIDAQSVQSITADFIGVGRNHTGADVLGATVHLAANGLTGQGPATADLPADTPWDRPRNLIFLHGAPTSYLGTADAREAIGNIQVNGIIGTVTANAGGGNTKGVFEGITGPIVASDGDANSRTDGRIERVNIGDGIAFGGTGDVPLAGVFAADVVGEIRNRGLGSDIRGPVVSGFTPGPLLTTTNPVDGVEIRSIRLDGGGSIIGSAVMITDLATDWREVPLALGIPEVPDSINMPRFDIGGISISGPGGIMGTYIQGPDIGGIHIDGGFGVIHCLINSSGDNRIDGISTSGLGIRDTIIQGGGAVTTLAASGTGKTLSTNQFTPTVRVSKGGHGFDPFTGIQVNEMTDLYRYLGTTPAHPKKSATTTDGVIENLTASATRELDGLGAYTVRQRGAGEMRLSFGNKVSNFSVKKNIDGLELDSGSLKDFTTGGEVARTKVNIAGTISSINIGTNLKGSSTINARGPEGRILSLTTGRALFGGVFGQVAIGTINVGTDLGSANVRASDNLDKLNVTRDVLSGANVKVTNTLQTLVVGGAVQDGAVIQAGSIGSQSVAGGVQGDIIVT